MYLVVELFAVMLPLDLGEAGADTECLVAELMALDPEEVFMACSGVSSAITVVKIFMPIPPPCDLATCSTTCPCFAEKCSISAS